MTHATFTLYSSTTLDVTPLQPRGASKLCLSCHDGTIAVENFGGFTSGTNYVTGAALIGTDLSNDHPISIDWQHQTVTGPTAGNSYCVRCHFGGPHGDPYNLKLPFLEGYVECSTCHDVHNNSEPTKLLRLPLTNSELCLYCHIK